MCQNLHHSNVQTMASTTPNVCTLLPFHGLTNNQFEFELNTTKRNISNRLHDNTLQNYFKNILIDSFPLSESINCEYYDDLQFIEMSKYYASKISVFHMNIRKFSKHRGELLAYLKVWKMTLMLLFYVKSEVMHLLISLPYSMNIHVCMSCPMGMIMGVSLYM